MIPHLLLLLAPFGSEPDAETAGVPLDVHAGTELTAEQVREVKARAMKAFYGRIERIYVGQLVHPFANVGFRVEFEDEVLGTYVLRRRFFLKLLPESGKQAQAEPTEKASRGKRPRLPDGLVPEGLQTHVKRLLPLRKHWLCLTLPDTLSYRRALDLFQAIESRKYRVKAPTDGSQTMALNPLDLSNVTSIVHDEEWGTVEVYVHNRRFSGTAWTFALGPEGLLLISTAHWSS